MMMMMMMTAVATIPEHQALGIVLPMLMEEFRESIILLIDYGDQLANVADQERLFGLLGELILTFPYSTQRRIIDVLDFARSFVEEHNESVIYEILSSQVLSLPESKQGEAIEILDAMVVSVEDKELVRVMRNVYTYIHYHNAALLPVCLCVSWLARFSRPRFEFSPSS